ncbi:hypothetical protein [Cryptosporangium arvum]|uniref:Uncharacterized protein n=1 Tax=Cryptosporangium arvum DSM 44712 TaxID=927661 RepID=A0A010YX51_9ACTN|nr:hypothetical protein [Cryptosporangium arvum]EXG79728.1 hypothetical protein CryarDRAFT_0772 [Cryptosporangium arvum DSM 44712]
MTANPSDATPSDLEARDAAARDAVPNPEAPDVTGYLPEIDARPAEKPRPAIPPIPKWVVPAVAAVLVFGLLAFPFGWSVWAALIGAVAAGAISYAFVFKL